jgi:hypothetical protein
MMMATVLKPLDLERTRTMDTQNVFRELQLEAGFQQGINNENLLKYSQQIVNLCVQICLRGDKTQTSCYGAALAIKEHFK